jgi:hypothetical protein
MNHAREVIAMTAGGAAVFIVGVGLVFGIALLDNAITEVCHGHSSRVACAFDLEHPASMDQTVEHGSSGSTP